MPLITPSGPIGRKSHSLVFVLDRLVGIEKLNYIFTDVIAFVCLVVFILKLKAEQGQSHMTRVLRTILQDGILYFFVTAGFHVAMLFFTIRGRVIAFLSLVERYVLILSQPSIIPPNAIIVYVFYRSS